jgi:hypothetical protein
MQCLGSRLSALLALSAALLPAAAAAASLSNKPPRPAARADPADVREYLIPSDKEKSDFAKRWAGCLAFV